MKERPRTRKVVKWAGALLCGLIVGAFVLSLWRTVSVIARVKDTGMYVVCVSDGVLIVAKGLSSPLPSELTLYVQGASGQPVWWFSTTFFEPDTRRGRNLVVPLWALLVPTATVTLLAWRRDSMLRRRRRAGACLKCGYDRNGLAENTVCPECGASAE